MTPSSPPAQNQKPPDLSALADQVRALLAKGFTPRQWLPLADAAAYCGFSGDRKCRAFLEFAAAEGIKYRPGNAGSKYDKLFSLAELDRVMRRDQRAVCN